jgi:hypothetical protein
MYVLDGLSQARMCARCQGALTPGAAFCGACGLATPAESETEGRAISEQPKFSQDDDPSRRHVLSTGETVLIELISWIPLINLIAWLVWMLGSGSGVQRARIAQSKLIVSCVLLAGTAAAIGILALLVNNGVLETLPLPTLEWP